MLKINFAANHKQMKTRKIGSLIVSEIGMGCMGFSHGYGQVPDEGYAIDAIRAAFDFGCTHFDTAEGYGNVMFGPGHNERIVGKALKAVRHKVSIATKLHLKPDEVASYSVYDAVRRHLEQSMKNLQTDCIDLYYLHRVNEEVSFEKVAEAMGRLREEGAIREWGMSQVDAETLAKANAITPVAAVQNLYNILERDCEKEVFPFCLEQGITVVPFSPIASGFLSGKITTLTQWEKVDDVRKFVPQLTKENIEGNQPILHIIKEYAEKKEATPAQIALAWMLKKYPNVVPIPGSKNKERILENLGACKVELTDEEFAQLQEALDAQTIFGHRGIVETEQHGFGNNWKKKE